MEFSGWKITKRKHQGEGEVLFNRLKQYSWWGQGKVIGHRLGNGGDVRNLIRDWGWSDIKDGGILSKLAESDSCYNWVMQAQQGQMPRSGPRDLRGDWVKFSWGRSLCHQQEQIHISSSAHRTFSRIDHVLGHKTILNKFKKIEIIQSFPTAIEWN